MTAHEFNLIKNPLLAQRIRQLISEAVETLYSEQFDTMDALVASSSDGKGGSHLLRAYIAISVASLLSEPLSDTNVEYAVKQLLALKSHVNRADFDEIVDVHKELAKLHWQRRQLAILGGKLADRRDEDSYEGMIYRGEHEMRGPATAEQRAKTRELADKLSDLNAQIEQKELELLKEQDPEGYQEMKEELEARELQQEVDAHEDLKLKSQLDEVEGLLKEKLRHLLSSEAAEAGRGGIGDETRSISDQFERRPETCPAVAVELHPRAEEARKASERTGPSVGPMLLVTVALLVVLGTTQSTRPWLLVLGICNVLVAVHLGGYVVAGWLAGASIESIEMFYGRKIAAAQVKNISLSIGWLPIGGSVRFRHSADPERAPQEGNFTRLPLAWRLTIHASGVLALFLLACVCIGVEEAATSIFHGLYQVVAGAIAPLSLGQALVRRAIEMPQRDCLAVAFGVLATKLAAGNLIPLGPSNGWHLLTQIVPERYRESKAFLGMIYLGLFCWLGLAVGWGIAICKAAIIAFQGG